MRPPTPIQTRADPLIYLHFPSTNQSNEPTGLNHYLYYKWIDRRFPYHLFTEEKFGKPEGTFYKVFFPWRFIYVVGVACLDAMG